MVSPNDFIPFYKTELLFAVLLKRKFSGSKKIAKLNVQIST